MALERQPVGSPCPMEILLDPNIWIAFAMLTALEIVLGVDNIVFTSIVLLLGGLFLLYRASHEIFVELVEALNIRARVKRHALVAL